MNNVAQIENRDDVMPVLTAKRNEIAVIRATDKALADTVDTKKKHIEEIKADQFAIKDARAQLHIKFTAARAEFEENTSQHMKMHRDIEEYKDILSKCKILTTNPEWIK